MIRDVVILCVVLRTINQVKRCSGCSLYVALQNAWVLGIQHKSQPSLWINARLLQPILSGNRGFAWFATRNGEPEIEI